MTHPLPPNLRPMGVGDTLDAIFRLYRGNFVTFIGIAALLQVPVILLQLVLSLTFGQQMSSDLLSLVRELPSFEPGEDLFSTLPIGGFVGFFAGSTLLSLLETIVIQQLINGALANAISHRMRQEPITILGAYQLGGKCFAALFGVGAIVAVVGGIIALGFIGIYIGMLFTILGSVGSDDSRGALSAIAIFFCILGLLIILALVFAIIAVRFLFVTQAIVLEGYGAFGALRRSWQMMSGSFWRILGVVILLSILVQIIVGIPVGITSLALNVILGSANDPLSNFGLRQSVSILVSYMAQLLVLPIQLIAYTLLYYDVRVRREGLDLEMMTQSLPDMQA